MYLAFCRPSSSLFQYGITTPPEDSDFNQSICQVNTSRWSVLNIDFSSAWLMVNVQDAVRDSLIDEIGQKLARIVICEISILEFEKLESADWRWCDQGGQDRVRLIAAQIVIA